MVLKHHIVMEKMQKFEHHWTGKSAKPYKTKHQLFSKEGEGSYWKLRGQFYGEHLNFKGPGHGPWPSFPLPVFSC